MAFSRLFVQEEAVDVVADLGGEVEEPEWLRCSVGWRVALACALIGRRIWLGEGLYCP